MVRKASQSKSSSSMLSKAMDVSKANQAISALLYGRSGTGKTTLSGTFPGPLLVLDIGERGTGSISDVKGAKVLKINEWKDFEDVYFELKKGGHSFESVSVDSLHALQALAINHVKKQAKKSDDDQTSQRDFGQAGALMQQWIRNYRDLVDDDMNIVFLAHDRVHEYEGEDDEMITPEVGPRLMPAVASCAVGSVNVVGYTMIKQTVSEKKKLGQKAESKIEYCLRIGPHPLYTTKIRTDKNNHTPEFIVDPTYDKLVSVIKGEEKKVSSRRKLNRK